MIEWKIDAQLQYALEGTEGSPDRPFDVSVHCYYEIDEDMRSEIEETGCTILKVEDNYARVKVTVKQITSLSQLDGVLGIKLPHSKTSVD